MGNALDKDMTLRCWGWLWLGNRQQTGVYVLGRMVTRERSIYMDFIHVRGPRPRFEEVAVLAPCVAPSVESRTI